MLFYDAGQVQPGPTLQGPAAFVPDGGSLATIVDAGHELQPDRTSRRRPALEVRFFMPVLNVPFRLIFAYNPQRAGVLDNTLPAAEGVPVPVRRRLDLLNGRRIWCRINGFRHSKGFSVMRGSAIAASLALSSSR